MVHTFHITLSDLAGLEAFHSRQFDLPVNKSFPVGRSSQNAAKPELLPSASNAYINSPVISREHALLTAVYDADGPRLYIEDVGSMHGTRVNGDALTSHTPHTLVTGDTLQFGVDVNRNQEFYVARKYTISISSKPNPTGFSLGFTVPDSEEEDVTIMNLRGSQINPVTIDDSDQEDGDLSQVSDARKPELDITVIKEDLVELDDDVQRDVHDDERLGSAMRTTLEQDSESESDAASSPIHDTDVNEESYGFQSDMDSDAEVSSELDLDFPVVDHDALFDDDGAMESRAEIPSLSQEPSMILDLVGHDQGGQYSMPHIKELPSFASVFDDGAISGYALPPPLPPRPISHMEQVWLAERGMSSTMTLPQQSSPIVAHPGFSNANQIQTPPPVPDFEESSVTPPLPTRRTRVSITEIVEEQPPTPTSINNLKRKAEDLDEDDTSEQEQDGIYAMDVSSSCFVEAFDDAAKASGAKYAISPQHAVDGTIIARRPKKQPRSIINRLKHGAAYVGYGAVGAVGAFALLANLPDTFFT